MDDDIKKEFPPREDGEINASGSEENTKCDGLTTPPPVEREFKVEEEWAETLGMDFDAKRVAESQTPPPAPEEQLPPQAGMPGGNRIPPVYVMPPGPDVPVPDPMPGHGFRPEPMPPTYLLWAILATICCCLPAGIVAIVFSSSVSTKYYSRDYEGARRASRNAEIWIIASIVAGIVVNALYMPLSLMIPV